MYVHLRNRQEHGQNCTERACGDGCGFLALEGWLSAPLIAADVEADERLRQRREALMRGDIPA